MDKKLIAVAAASALALPMSAHALEGSISGHVGRVIQHVDGPGEAKDGPKWNHADLGASPSRFRFTGSEELDNGVTIGVNLEYAVGANQGNSPGLRHSALTFSGAFGSIAAGQTAPATNGTNDDLSASGLAVDMACSNAAGKSCPDFTAGRRGVVKYTTPAIGVAGFSGSAGPDFWDAQLSSSGELGAGSYALRASFAADGDNSPNGGRVENTHNHDGGTLNSMSTPALIDANETFSVAVAFKVGGASVNTLWGSTDYDAASKADHDGYGVKLGYDFGDSGIGLLFRQTDMDGTDKDPTTWGLGVQHNMMGVDLFAGYYSYDPDDGKDETNTFTVGSRIKF